MFMNILLGLLVAYIIYGCVKRLRGDKSYGRERNRYDNYIYTSRKRGDTTNINDE